MATMTENKKRVLDLMSEAAKTRKGVDKLVKWLEGTDFFTAPASTRFHGAYEGGLLEHSLNVYDEFNRRFPNEEDATSVIICALLHDLCKTNFYGVEYRNRKNEQGAWEKVPVYVVNDQFPYGHGEKSVFLIERFFHLKTEELFAIRWHMGGFDDSVKGGSYALNGAFEKYPLAVKLHVADMCASYLVEARGPQEQTH